MVRLTAGVGRVFPELVSARLGFSLVILKLSGLTLRVLGRVTGRGSSLEGPRVLSIAWSGLPGHGGAPLRTSGYEPDELSITTITYETL